MDHTLINWGQANAGGHSKGSPGLRQVKSAGGGAGGEGEVLGVCTAVEGGWVGPAASGKLGREWWLPGEPAGQRP